MSFVTSSALAAQLRRTCGQSTISDHSAASRCGSGKGNGRWTPGQTGWSRWCYSPGLFGCPYSLAIPSSECSTGVGIKYSSEYCVNGTGVLLPGFQCSEGDPVPCCSGSSFGGSAGDGGSGIFTRKSACTGRSSTNSATTVFTSGGNSTRNGLIPWLLPSG